MRSDILGRTGAELESVIRVSEPAFDTAQLLTEYFQLDPLESSHIAQQARVAKIITSAEGSLALEGIAPRFTPGEERTLTSTYFPASGSIVINGSMASVFAQTIERSSVLQVEHSQAVAAGIRAAGIYELGRFVSRRIYTDLIYKREFRATGMPVPYREGECFEFFDAIGSELDDREVPGSWSKLHIEDEQVAMYKRNIRPERFYSRGGLVALKAVSPQLNADTLLTSLRQTVIDSYVGSAPAQLIEADDEVAQHVPLPSLYDLAVLLPLGCEDFNQLCSYVSRTHDPKVTSLHSQV